MTTPTDTQERQRTPSATVHAASTKGKYKGAGLIKAPTRPGAANALSIPSRIGDHLYHRDGKVTTYPGVAP